MAKSNEKCAGDMGNSCTSAEKKIRCYKIRTLDSERKYGIACKNLAELKQKACRKFQLDFPTTRVCLYEDGTELSEGYFKTVADNTVLLLLTPGQMWQGYVSDVERFLNAFYTRQTSIVDAALKLLADEDAPKRQKLLADFISNLNENILAEKREDDESWFEGIEPRFKNKSNYMRYSCESRVRSYMKEVQSHTDSVDPLTRDEYKRIIDAMCNELRAVKYNGCYFDRTEQKPNRLCTSEGWFSCQGAFDSDACTSKHSINPYSNRESRILFSTWNLDHIIEKKRTIIPCLVQTLKERNERQVNWEYFFSLLFTKANLKLVHIACHKKTSHNLSCDSSQIYRKRKAPKRTLK